MIIEKRFASEDFVEIQLENLPDIPEALPNPNAITFTGAVEATYDGSQEVSIEIPTGGAGGVSSWNDLTDKPFGETEDGEIKTIDSKYLPEIDMSEAVNEAKSYTDTAVNKVKDDLLNGAGEAYDTLKELGDLIDDNKDALEALETIATGKADKEHTHSWNDLEDRPFYEIEATEEVLIPETTVSNFEEVEYFSGHMYCYSEMEVDPNNYKSFSLDKTYTVIWDGVAYNNVSCQDTMGAPTLGSSGRQLSGAYDEHNEYPFGIYVSGSTMRVYTDTDNYQPSHTVKVVDIKESEIKTIDPKYLPELQSVGKDVSGNTFLIDDTEVTAQTGAEIFNDYENNIATGNYSHAEGENTIASGYASHTEGYNTLASGWNSHAEGKSTKATKGNSHAEGESSEASGDTSHAEGYYTKASGNYSHAEGYQTQAGNYSHAEGSNTKALEPYSHAEGSHTETTGSYGHAEGYGTVAATYGHAEGNQSKAGNTAHAEGNNTEASGQNSHAEGTYTKATNTSAHAEGDSSEATGYNSHAEGRSSKATNGNTHAEGYYTEASGYQAHAEGNNSKATNENTHAEGYFTTASGANSHSEGYYTEAKGYASHAEGYYTIASGQYQHVQGKNNIEDTENKYVHIVGNGPYGYERSNAHTLDWNGNAWFAGSVESTAMILLSPNGTRFQITIGDDGVLTASEITAVE